MPRSNEKPNGNRNRLIRAALELTTLVTIAVAVQALINPDMPRINIPRFGLKWFVAEYLQAAILFVLIPFVPVFAVGALICRVSRKRNYWSAYRVAFVVAAIWAIQWHYFSWYGECRTILNHSVKYCSSFGWYSD